LAPAGDALVVAGEQNLGNLQALKIERFGILRVFEQRGKGFGLGCLAFFENTREKADKGVDQDHGGDFTAGKNIIANRDVGINKVFETFINAFVMAADKDEVG